MLPVLRHIITKKISYFLPLIAIAAGVCHADNLYFQGFEANTSGWFIDSGGDGNGSITRTLSGGGSLNLTAADGAYYAEVHNNTNAYQAGYGTGGYSLFGGVNSPSGVPFTQSIALYVNTTTAAPTNPGVPAFWIDMSPGSNDATPGYNAEHNFNLFYNGTSVSVEGDGSVPLATILASGWYQFSMTYTPDANPNNPVITTLQITTMSGTPVGVSYTTATDPNGVLMSSEVSGPGYVWLPVWQNGFSGDLLGIDDVRADDTSGVPEPATFALMGSALLLAGGFAKLRKRT